MTNRVSRIFYDGGEPAAINPADTSFINHVPEGDRSHFEGIENFGGLATKFVELSTRAPTSFDPTKFAEHMPEDIREQFGTVPNLEALGRGYLGAQKLVGKDPSSLIQRPVEGDAAGMVSALQSLGAPSDLAAWGDMKELAGEGGDAAFVQSYIEKVAIPGGMMPHQVKANLEFVREVAKAQGEAQTAQTAEQVAKWQGEMAQNWGVEVGSAAWKENIAQAASVVEQFGGDEAFDALDEVGLGDNPLIVNMFHKLATKLAGGTLEGTGGTGPALSGRAADINRQLAELQQKQMAAVTANRQAEARQIAGVITGLIEERNRLTQKQGQ